MRTLLISLTAFVFGIGSMDAFGSVLCGQRNEVVASLEKNYSEIPVNIGLASNGAVIEVLASPSGSFTIILTQPNGLSCVMAAGENWENLPKRLAGTHT